MIRNHVAWSERLAKRLAALPDFEIVSQPMLSLFSFRHRSPAGEEPDRHNLRLVNAINAPPSAGPIRLPASSTEPRMPFARVSLTGS